MGYENEITELKFDCECRKPKPGMLLQAAEDFNIGLSESIMVGDSEIDIKAGKAADCKTTESQRCGLVVYESSYKRKIFFGSRIERDLFSTD